MTSTTFSPPTRQALREARETWLKKNRPEVLAELKRDRSLTAHLDSKAKEAEDFAAEYQKAGESAADSWAQALETVIRAD